MVRSINGDRGSSVIPIGGDDWMFLGRGRHVWLDNNDIHMSGQSGNTLSQGIEASKNAKINQVRNVCGTMKVIEMVKIPPADEFMMKIGGHDIS